MKTVFKVGMEVWDKTISPNKGRVIEVFTDAKFDFPIKVEFENDIRARYTNKGCFVKSEGVLPTLSTTDYSLELKGFEQKAPAPTFEEVLVNCDKRYPPNIRADVDYKEIYPTKELSDAAEAIRRLLFLRDYYNEGWKPDWSNENEIHFCIRVKNNSITVGNNLNINNFNAILVFRDYITRDKFLNEQRELIQIAKPLL
ncbi:TPA: hypothetical protein WM907_001439 [Neisseria gonorrhoeae]|jgi:hypothetical protein